MLWFVNIEKITGRNVELEIIFKGDYLADIEELLLSDRVPGRAYSAFFTKGIDMEDKQKLLDHIDRIYTTKMEID